MVGSQTSESDTQYGLKVVLLLEVMRNWCCRVDAIIEHNSEWDLRAEGPWAYLLGNPDCTEEEPISHAQSCAPLAPLGLGSHNSVGKNPFSACVPSRLGGSMFAASGGARCDEPVLLVNAQGFDLSSLNSRSQL